MWKLLFCILCLSFSTTLFSQSGYPDPSFVPTFLNGGVKTIAIQVDGKIIIGGYFTINSSHLLRLNQNGEIDNSFNIGNGINGAVNCIKIQADGKIIIAGEFTQFNGINKNNIVRLNDDGSLDSSFNMGSGTDGEINCIELQVDGKIIIGGLFSNYNGDSISCITRLNNDGSRDLSFNIGNGANDRICSVALQSNGSIVIGGYFTYFNGIGMSYFARLNNNGSPDILFSLANQPNNAVWSVNVQTDDKIIVAGEFTLFNGANRRRIARLNAEGGIDAAFNPGTSGANQLIICTIIQPDGKIVIGGGFTSYYNTQRNYVARINIDGTLDNTFNPSTGTDGLVFAFAIQPDSRVLIGGQFNSYGGILRKNLARAYACSLSQPSNISGRVSLCSEETEIYSVNPVQDAENYTWTLPAGWSGSSNTNSITVTSGDYGGNVSVNASNSICGISPVRTLTVSQPEPIFNIPLCMVSVDEASNHNIVIWEKPISASIDSFFIFRETTTNNFIKIASVPYHLLNEYHDYDANPNITSWKYKVSMLDTCGFVSEQSSFHNTIHLQNLGNGNLSWTHYGIENAQNPVTYYRVYRDDFGTNDFVPITSTIPGGNSTFTDINFSSFPNARYLVDVAWNISCTPFRDSENTTRSNVLGLNPNSVSELENRIKIYPNPATHIITIQFPNYLNVLNLKIYNMLGELVYKEIEITENKKVINITGYTSGIYTLQLETQHGTAYKKLIVQ